MLVSLILTIAMPIAAAAVPSSPLLPPHVERAISARIADGEYPAMGAVAVDGGRGRINTFGNLKNGKAPDADTAFQIGSATKTFTTTQLAEAVNEAKAKLDTPIVELLPRFTLPSRQGKPVTLGELDRQDSGLPSLPDNLDLANMQDPYACCDAAKLDAFLAQYEPPRIPRAFSF